MAKITKIEDFSETRKATAMAQITLRVPATWLEQLQEIADRSQPADPASSRNVTISDLIRQAVFTEYLKD